MMNEPVNIGIVGATGYAGGELLRLLSARSDVCVAAITSDRAAGKHVTDFYPALRGWLDLYFDSPSLDSLVECDLVFFATPHGVAMNMAPDLLEAGKRVVDLSADFRLRDADVWASWYGQAHKAPEWLPQAVYGLPELSRSGIDNARLVAAPGCFVTAVVLGLKPLLESGLIEQSGIIADAKTGASGAGRTSNPVFGFAEVAESMRAYGVAGHRHLPEIQQALDSLSASPVDLTFVPHLVPMVRGMQATLYARRIGSGDVRAAFEAAYTNEAFIDVLPAGHQPTTAQVRATNNAMLGVSTLESGRIIVTTVIDNLLKGAAGQAVQCFNRMIGVSETTGLEAVASWP